jgi:hypothetical protein
MGAERRRSRSQMQTNASHTKHAHIRQGLNPPTQVSQGDRTTGNRGQPQTTSAEGQERLRNATQPDTQVRARFVPRVWIWGKGLASLCVAWTCFVACVCDCIYFFSGWRPFSSIPLCKSDHNIYRARVATLPLPAPSAAPAPAPPSTCGL